MDDTYSHSMHYSDRMAKLDRDHYTEEEEGNPRDVTATFLPGGCERRVSRTWDRGGLSSEPRRQHGRWSLRLTLRQHLGRRCGGIFSLNRAGEDNGACPWNLFTRVEKESQDCDTMTDVRAHDVDKGWAWVVLSAVALSLVLQEAFLFCTGIFQMEFLDVFPGSQGFMALIGAFAGGGQVFMGPVAGILSDQLTHRVTVMLGGALMSIAFMCASFSQDITTLFLLFGVLAGIGAGLSYAPSVTVTSMYFHRYRTIANGLTLGAPGVGILAGPYLLRWLIDSYGWRYALAVYGGLMAQICVLGALFFPVTPGHLNMAGCCSSSGRLPSRDVPAPEASEPTEVTVTSHPSEDISITEQDCMLGSKTKKQFKGGSRTDLGFKARSETDLGSKTNLKVKWGSLTDLAVKAGSRTGLQSRPLSRSALQVSEFGSGVLSQSIEFKSESTVPVRQRLTGLLCHKFIWIICFNQLLMICGHAINVVLFPAFARSTGVAFKDIPALYTAYGVTISVSRVAGGFLFSAIPEHLIHVLFGLQVAQALVFAFLPVYGVSLPALFVGVVSIGLTYGPSIVLLSPILLRYLDLQDLTIAFGLVMLTYGIGFLGAPTIAGITYDISHSYNASYYIAGSTIGAGSFVLLLLLFIKDLEPPGRSRTTSGSFCCRPMRKPGSSGQDTANGTTYNTSV